MEGGRPMVSPDASPSPLKRSATKALVQVQSQTERFIDPRFHDAKKLTKGVDIPGTPVGFDRLVIRPGNRLVGVFDFIIAICVIYSAIVAPLKVAYQASFMNDVEIVFDVLFVMDMVLQCLYGYMEGGYPVLSLKLVTVRYARSWFLVDLIAVLPWETFAAEFSFLVLIKTVRLLRLRRMLSGLNMRSGSNFLRVVIILSVWLLITHWCACTFFALGWGLCGRTYEQTWVTVYFDGSDEHRAQGLPVLSDTCGEGTPPGIGKIHIRAMYWALSTMSSLGYGEAPVAVTDAEYCLAIAVQVLGACLAAVIFSNIAKLIERLDAAGSRYSAHLDRINEFGKFFRLPTYMQQKLQNYVTFSFSVSRGISIQEVTASLPLSLREEVLYLMHEQLLRKVPMFKDTDDAFIKVLVRMLQPQVLLRGDYLFRMNEPGDCMYFIKNGCVQIKNLDCTVVFATLKPGAYFGELAMLTQQRRTATAQAITDCILFFMRAADFDDAMKDFPKYYDSILEGAMLKLEKTLEYNSTVENKMVFEKTRKKLMKNRASRMAQMDLDMPQEDRQEQAFNDKHEEAAGGNKLTAALDSRSISPEGKRMGALLRREGSFYDKGATPNTLRRQASAAAMVLGFHPLGRKNPASVMPEQLPPPAYPGDDGKPFSAPTVRRGTEASPTPPPPRVADSLKKSATVHWTASACGDADEVEEEEALTSELGLSPKGSKPEAASQMREPRGAAGGAKRRPRAASDFGWSERAGVASKETPYFRSYREQADADAEAQEAAHDYKDVSYSRVADTRRRRFSRELPPEEIGVKQISPREKQVSPPALDRSRHHSREWAGSNAGSDSAGRHEEALRERDEAILTAIGALRREMDGLREMVATQVHLTTSSSLAMTPASNRRLSPLPDGSGAPEVAAARAAASASSSVATATSAATVAGSRPASGSDRTTLGTAPTAAPAEPASSPPPPDA